MFVADPEKTSAVQNSLARNKEKILRFMNSFLLERENHSLILKEQKAQVVNQISEILKPVDWDDGWSMHSWQQS